MPPPSPAPLVAPPPAPRDRASAFHPSSFILHPFLPWLTAAALLLSTGYFATQNLVLTDEIKALRDADTLARLEARIHRNDLEAERIVDAMTLAELRRANLAADPARLQVATLNPTPGSPPAARAIVVWNPVTQEGVLDTSQLPVLASDRDYQLWLIDPSALLPVDGGVFRVDPATGATRHSFKTAQPVKTVSKFAVSLERIGGVPKAEGPMVLLSP